MDAGFCVEALKDALARYGTPEIFNTDQGSQFTSTDFTDVLGDAKVKISLDVGALDRQPDDRAALAIPQIRMRLLERLRNRFRSPRLDQLLQRKTPALITSDHDAGRGL